MVDSAEKQPFLSHLEELRKRLVVCAIGVGAGFVIAYIFAERLFQLLVAPLKCCDAGGRSTDLHQPA